MSLKARNLFHSVGRAIAGFDDLIAETRELNNLSNMPESAFRARGTTRDAAIRAVLKRL